MYWRKVGEKPDRYDVVRSVSNAYTGYTSELVDGEFHLPKDAGPIDEIQSLAADYQSLPDELRISVLPIHLGLRRRS